MQVTSTPPAPAARLDLAQPRLDVAQPRLDAAQPRLNVAQPVADAHPTPRGSGSRRTGSGTDIVRRTVGLPSPLGPLLATATEHGLARLHLPPHDAVPAEETQLDPAQGAAPAAHHEAVDQVLAATREQLAAYFAGELVAFDLPLDLGGSRHQEAVWALLRAVPYGTTTTYKAIAVRLGSPGASRAVGSANARNPVAIVVPCHRVIGSDGMLTGYAAGLPHKRWLLAHEQAQAADGLF